MNDEELWAAVDPATLKLIEQFPVLFYRPSPRQVEFFDNGAWSNERMLRAGNQLGKSDAGAVETAFHLTGVYPDWWRGYRFTKPIRAWLCCESLALVRDIQQNKLCGRSGVEADFGTGFIPHSCFVGRPTASHGATGGFDTIFVKHISGGTSTATAKAYEQGRAKFQGEPVDWIWIDEEPPFEVYDECLTRTKATDGLVIVTYTPLKGRTHLVSYFDRFNKDHAPRRHMVKMSVWDCVGYHPHLKTNVDAANWIAGFPEHQRQARAYGDPVLGEGAIFDTPEDEIKWEREIPVIHGVSAWPLIWGVDFGISHPFAAVLLAWDKDNDVVYVVDGFKTSDTTKLQHVPRMRDICSAAPVAWPKDGHDRDKGSGEELAEQYKRPMPGMPGVNMLSTHATFEEGGYSTEAGVAEMVARAATGRLRVAEHMFEFFEEYRDYHREKGLIVKTNDDMLSATRTALIQRRSAKCVPLGDYKPRYLSFGPPMRENKGWDIFTGSPL